MARFTQPVAPTSDPNYMMQNQSRALPSWEAQSAVDRAGPGALENFGKVIADGIKGADTKNDMDIREGLYKDIDAARTASTDSAFQSAAGMGAAVPGATAPTGTNSDTNPDGAPDVFGSGGGVPANAAAAIGGLKNMKEAALQGGLNDSHYYMTLEATAAKYRAMYPGYRDQIDQMISQISGVDPANALRKNAIAVMEKAAAAANDGQAKMLGIYREDQGYFEALHPGLTFGDFQKNPQQYMAEAGNLKAQKIGLESQKLQLDLGNAKDAATAAGAERLFTNESNMYVSTFTTGALNKLRDQGINLASQGANANPTEVAQFMSQATALKAQISSQIDALATRPLRDGSSNSYTTLINDPKKLAAIKEQAMSPIETIIQSVGGKDYTVANAAATINKMQNDQTWQKLTQKIPAIEVYSALRQHIGDQTTGLVFSSTNGAGLNDLTKSVLDTHWMAIGNGASTTPPPSVSDAITAVDGSNPVNPGRVHKLTVQGIQTLAGSDNPKDAARAVQSLYGDTQFFANIKDSEKAAVYSTLTSPAFTKKMVVLRQQDPASFDKYVNWAQQNGITVFKQGVDDLQSGTEFNRYNTTFDPKTLQFTAVTKPEFVDKYQKAGYGDPATAYVSKINQLGASLAPILKEKYGDQAPQQFLHILEANGYNPNAPQKGTWIESLGSAVASKVEGAASDAVDYLKKTGQQLSTQGRSSQLEMEDSPNKTALHETVKQAESAGDYNSVFGAHSRNLNLTGMTVGEVMALQQHRLAQGEPSSAAGAYQFLLPTLKSLVKEGAVRPDDPFSEETQDKLATVLMKRRGLDDYTAGKISKQQFADNLAKEWAGLPTTSGRSYYEGDGLNHATVRLPQVLASLAQLGDESAIPKNAKPSQYSPSNVWGDAAQPPAQWMKDGTVNSPEEDKQLTDYETSVSQSVTKQYKTDNKGRLEVPENFKAPDGFRGTVVMPSGIQMSFPGVMRRRTYK